MFVEPYFQDAGAAVSFSRQQASDFAKRVADDFNPLHDVAATRFCVPGDLMFSVLLSKYGISEHMEFKFSGMVPEGLELILPEPAQELQIQDAEGREYLQVTRRGDNDRDAQRIEQLARGYVAFSGHSFPDLLVPMLAEQNVMINPKRPMVMYASMGIDLDRLDFANVTVELDHGELEVEGKRGVARLVFNLREDGELFGCGRKTLLLTGLREYDAATMDEGVATYNAGKAAFFAEQDS